MPSSNSFIEEDMIVDAVPMMGGAKKKGFAQMEKAQTTQERPAPTKKEKAKPAEKKTKAVDISGIHDERLLGEIKKMGAVTAFAVASQFNIRVGAAKDLLEELTRRKAIEPVGGNARIRVYRAVAA